MRLWWAWAWVLVGRDEEEAPAAASVWLPAPTLPLPLPLRLLLRVRTELALSPWDMAFILSLVCKACKEKSNNSLTGWSGKRTRKKKKRYVFDTDEEFPTKECEFCKQSERKKTG